MKRLFFLLFCPLLMAQGEIQLSASGVMADPSERKTIVQVRAVCETGKMVAFQGNKPGTIRKFMDNRGANLMVGAYHWNWTRNVEFSRGGRLCTLELVGAKLPARGAGKVTVEGKLHFVLADERIVDRETVELKKNTATSVGEQFLEVVHLSPVRGKPEMAVQILYSGYDQAHSPINTIKYYCDGEELSDKKVSFIRDNRGHLALLTLPRDVKTFEIEIDFWSNWEEVTAPYRFDLDL